MPSEIVDIPEFLERVMGDHALVKELLDDFVKDFEKKRKLLQKAVEAKDYPQIKEIAHGIKGASGNISVKSMHACCMLIEYLAGNQDIELIRVLMTDLNNQFLELQKYIAELKKKPFKAELKDKPSQINKS